MKNLSAKWQKLIVWLTGYLNIIAFFLAGGYVYTKTQDEEVKNSAKTALVLVAGFTALEMLRGLIYYIMQLANAGYETLSAMSDVSYVLTIIKIVVFATMFALDFFGIQLKRAAVKPVVVEVEEEEQAE